jgi:AraC family transcriptional regulator
MPLNFTSQNRRDEYLHRVDKAIRFMESHLSSEVDLESAAHEAGFSPFHFHRIFTGVTGETPQNYLTRLRMERAANVLVKSPAVSITEIAFTCGYSSASAFARSFKRYFGIPAGEFARQSMAEGRPVSWVRAKAPILDEPFSLPEIRIQPMPALHLAVFKSPAGYSPEGVKSAWVKMFHWAQSRQLNMGQAKLIAISYDDPMITEMRRCRYYACLTIPETIVKDTRAGILDLPEHLCAVCRLTVDTDQFMSAYRSLYRDWLPDSGFLMTDLPPYEIYHNAPDVDPDSKYVFDLCVPVEAL